jgi:hypothetical protein
VEGDDMREHFPWAVGLGQAEFERALLVAGLLPPSLARATALANAQELAGGLLHAWQRLEGEPWWWRLRAGALRLVTGSEAARTLADAAERLLDTTRRSEPGLRLEVRRPPEVDWLALVRALRGGGADSLYVREGAEGEISWDWPLRIGASAEGPVLARLRAEPWLAPLYDCGRWEGAMAHFHLLFFEGDLREAARRLLASPRPPRADAVIVLAGADETAPGEASLFALVRSLTSAQGVFAIEPNGQRPDENAVQLVVELGHSHPLDVAAARVGGSEGSVFALATRSLVAGSDLRRMALKLARSLRTAALPQREPPRMMLMEEAADALGFVPINGIAAVEAADVGGALEDRLPMLDFGHESGGGRIMASLARAAAPVLREEPVKRSLLSRLETPNGRPILPEQPLHPQRDYVATVHIGQPKAGWLGLGEPLDEPPPRADGQPHLLHVLFWEPSLAPEPQIQTLELWPRGDTEVLKFPFRTGKEGPFAARIAVYHRNRNLQTGILSAHIGTEQCEVGFSIDAAPAPRFVGLAERPEVGVSIVLNDDASGRMNALAFSDGQAKAAVDIDAPGGIAQLIQTIGGHLGRIATQSDRYQGLASEGCRELLRDLAQHGAILLERLQLKKHFDESDYVQVVRAHPEAYFPIEFLYGGEAPEQDARICAGDPAKAATALPAGRCCGAYACDPEHTICPLHFWSLGKVIERHAHISRADDLPRDFRLYGSVAGSARKRVLDPLQSAVLAASDKVDSVVPNTVAGVLGRIQARMRVPPVPLAEDWDAWAEAIAQQARQLLVLLPHHERQGGFEILEIGAGDQRRSTTLRARHVRPEGHAEIQPIVLLLGCETNQAKIDFESFVQRFRAHGAAIVVSTIATVLGRDAAPVAAEIVDELAAVGADPDASFGEVLRAVRRRVLAQGKPLVLGLTSYGDADWRIGLIP